MPVLDAGNVRWRQIIAASVLAAALAAGFIGSIAMLAVEIHRVIDAAPMAVPPHPCASRGRASPMHADRRRPQLTPPIPKGANSDVDDGHRHDA